MGCHVSFVCIIKMLFTFILYGYFEGGDDTCVYIYSCVVFQGVYLGKGLHGRVILIESISDFYCFVSLLRTSFRFMGMRSMSRDESMVEYMLKMLMQVLINFSMGLIMALFVSV